MVPWRFGSCSLVMHVRNSRSEFIFVHVIVIVDGSLHETQGTKAAGSKEVSVTVSRRQNYRSISQAI